MPRAGGAGLLDTGIGTRVREGISDEEIERRQTSKRSSGFHHGTDGAELVGREAPIALPKTALPVGGPPRQGRSGSFYDTQL